MQNRLNQVINSIVASDKDAKAKAQERLNSLVKIPSSLGVLEDIAVKMSAITGDTFYDPDKRCIIIMSSDNGVVEENVSSAPQIITYTQTLNFIKGITGVAVLAKQFNTDLIVVDVGINAEVNHPAIINKKIRKSTSNISKGSAMTRDEALRAILIGVDITISAKEQGYKVIGVGEMGIGNTTTSSAVLCGLLGINDPDRIRKTVGKGAGIANEAYEHKCRVIHDALLINKPNKSDPIDILSKVGGFDIAAMAGVFLGAASLKLPVVIDGFISAVAALCAFKLNSLVGEYLLPSHLSYERGYVVAIQELGLNPPLHMNMRLGEGSGCPLMFSMMDAAHAVIKDMGTFEEAQIDISYLEAVKDVF